MRRQACSVRILPDTKKNANSSDRRKSYILKVRKRPSAANQTSPEKKITNRSELRVQLSSIRARAQTNVSKAEESNSNAEERRGGRDAADDESDLESPRARRATLSNGLVDASKGAARRRDPADEANAAASSSDESKTTVSVAGSDPGTPSSRSQRSRDKFFDELPYEQQLLLLRRTENLSAASSAEAQKLAAELEAPFRSVYSWLKSKSIRKFSTWSTRLSREKIAVLDDEFAASPALSDDRALLLSYRLDLSGCAIRKYFERKRGETKPSLGGAADRRPAEAGGETPEAAASRCADPGDEDAEASLLNPLILVPQYVPSGSDDASSGVCLRSRAAAEATFDGGEKDRLRRRRFVLTLRQKKTLVEQFHKTPFVSPTDAAALAAKLGLPVKAVQLWFHRKRLEKNKSVDAAAETSTENETENQSSEETKV